MTRFAANMAACVAASALLATLAACGQKGPLYLPDKGGEVVTRPGTGQTQQLPQSPATTPQPAAQPQPTDPDAEKKNQAPK